MVILLVILSIVGIFIYVLLQEEAERKSMVKFFDSVKTMSLEELFAANDAAENEWDQWNKAWARKKDGSSELRKRKMAGEKANVVRREISNRFPNAITNMEKAKEKAYSVATSDQKDQMRVLEDKLQRQYRVMGASGIVGGQMLEKTHSSVLNGVAASKIGGPVAAGVVYTATEARNEAVTFSNISKKAQNETWDNMAEGAKKTKLQLQALYYDIISEHDPNAIIHIYRINYL